MEFSPLWALQVIFVCGFWKGDPEFMSMFHRNFVFILYCLEVIPLCSFGKFESRGSEFFCPSPNRKICIQGRSYEPKRRPEVPEPWDWVGQFFSASSGIVLRTFCEELVHSAHGVGCYFPQKPRNFAKFRRVVARASIIAVSFQYSRPVSGLFMMLINISNITF